MASQYGDTPKYVFLCDASMDNIHEDNKKVNRVEQKDSEKRKQFLNVPKPRTPDGMLIVFWIRFTANRE